MPGFAKAAQFVCISAHSTKTQTHLLKSVFSVVHVKAIVCRVFLILYQRYGIQTVRRDAYFFFKYLAFPLKKVKKTHKEGSEVGTASGVL